MLEIFFFIGFVLMLLVTGVSLLGVLAALLVAFPEIVTVPLKWMH